MPTQGHFLDVQMRDIAKDHNVASEMTAKVLKIEVFISFLML